MSTTRFETMGEYAGHEEDHRLHYLVVPGLHGFHGQQTSAGPSKHHLRHHRTRQQEAGHQPEVGEGRSRRTHVVGRLLLASLHIAEGAWGLALLGVTAGVLFCLCGGSLGGGWTPMAGVGGGRLGAMGCGVWRPEDAPSEGSCRDS